MKMIYIVTSGDYSSYSLDAAFDDIVLAQRFVKMFGGRIEEHEINPNKKTLKNGYKAYHVEMMKNGDVSLIYETGNGLGWFGQSNHFTMEIDQTSKELLIHYSCIAKDENHAIKQANEKRIFLIAENQWSVSK